MADPVAQLHTTPPTTMDARLSSNEQLFTYLLEEMRLSMSHYAHLEVQRSQYLAFYFTLVLGSTGFIVTVVKDIAIDQLGWMASSGLGYILLLNATIGGIILAAIKKLGFALSMHTAKVGWIRETMLAQEVFTHDDMLGTYRTSNAMFRSRVFSAQRSAEYLVGMLSVAFLLLFAGHVVYLWMNAAPPAQIVLNSLLGLALASYLVRILLVRMAGRQDALELDAPRAKGKRKK